eukprot:6580969-Prymnesium_polylepis.1
MRVKVETRTRSMCAVEDPCHTARYTVQCTAGVRPTVLPLPSGVHVTTRPRTVRGACRIFRSR